MATPSLAMTAIGIDMGTTYCYVGVYKNGSVEVIANEQGNRATPCFVAYTPKERVVGEAAYNHQHLNQANTLYHVKSMLGYDYADPAFQKILEASKFPFEVTEGDDKKPRVTVEFQGKPATFTPEEVVGVLFRQIKQTASQYMGFPIDKAVISVPAHYNDRQRDALLEAAKLAELQVLTLCTEQAAVAMAYKLDEPPSSSAKPQHQNVVVVDMGGVSTSISVLGVQAGIMELLGFDQDTHLGGEHIDERLMDHFTKEFSRKNDGLDLTQSARAMTRLRHNCEKAKMVLSAAPIAPIEVDAIFEGVDLFSSISRSKFEGLCADFFKRIISALDRALAHSNVEKDDVHALIISGGCGKIPKIREVIRNYFGSRVRLLAGVQNVDEAVAFGCAIQASLMVTATPEAAVSDVSEVRLNTLSVGVANAQGELQVLIPKHTPLPTLKTVHTTVNGLAKGAFLQLYEGEILRTASKNHLLATIALDKLEGTADMKLEVSMDADANIDVQITHSASRTRVAVHVPAAAGEGKKLSEAEVTSMLAAGHAEHQELLEANKALKEQCDALEARGSELQRAVAAGVVAGSLNATEQRIMDKAVDDVTAWLENLSVGPIIHAKKEDIEKKGKGLELIFGAFSKKMDAAAAAPAAAAAAAAAPVKAAAAPTPAPAPMPVMDMGDLD